SSRPPHAASGSAASLGILHLGVHLYVPTLAARAAPAGDRRTCPAGRAAGDPPRPRNHSGRNGHQCTVRLPATLAVVGPRPRSTGTERVPHDLRHRPVLRGVPGGGPPNHLE